MDIHMQGRQKTGFFIGVIAIALIFSRVAQGHGSNPGAAADERQKPVKTGESRRVPTKPGPLSQLDIKRLANIERTPSDVVLIRSTLSSHATGRGLGIGIFDDHDHLIASANSGTEGVVGFEGLDPDGRYEARVLGSKYEGSVAFEPGRVLVLSAGRKSGGEGESE